MQPSADDYGLLMASKLTLYELFFKDLIAKGKV